LDGEAELFREGTDELDGGWVGGVIGAELGVGEPLLAEEVVVLERLFAPDDDGDVESVVVGRGFFTGCCE
jgi:hypothetical protein